MDDSRPHILICRTCGRPHDPANSMNGGRESYWDNTVQDSVEATEFSDAIDTQVRDNGVRDNGVALAIAVEPNVLACCNGAYDRAMSVGAAEVGLLDLLHVIASTATLEAWLVAYDIDRDLLRIEIDALEAASPEQHEGNRMHSLRLHGR